MALATAADWPALAPDDRAIAPALASAGVDAEVAIWTDGGMDWSRFDLVVVRSCWDYHHDLPRWLDWVREVGAASAPTPATSSGGLTPDDAATSGAESRLCNPPEALRWNARKTYLAELGARGVPIVPTFWIDSSELESWSDLCEAARAAPWDDIVLKPAVSAGALGAVHVARAALASSEATLGGLLPELARRGPLLVQPYLPEIATQGEWSLVFFEGKLSHAVLKRPAPGDFRVQEKHGGSTLPATPAPDLVIAAEQTLAVAATVVSEAAHATAPRPSARDGGPWLYARVDLVVSGGRPLLVELELTEPALFLSTTGADPSGPTPAQTLAAAIASRA